jgi:hypothetical protein
MKRWEPVIVRNIYVDGSPGEGVFLKSLNADEAMVQIEGMNMKMPKTRLQTIEEFKRENLAKLEAENDSAQRSAIDYLCAEYLLLHQDGIKEDLKKLKLEAETNPILDEYLHDAIVGQTITILTQALCMSYEDIASIVDKNYILNLIGEGYFQL